MGQKISRHNFKNFSFPTLKQSNNSKKVISCYPKQMELDKMYMKCKCPVYSLKYKKEITQEQINKNYGQYQLRSDLTLLTYNVWFESTNQQNRIKAIFSILKQSKADIICLQQVNGTFLKSLFQYSSDLTHQFDYFIPQMNMHWYDTLVITKFPCKFYKIPFQSTMGRCNLLAVFQLKTKQTSRTVGINTVHLESLDNQKLRVKQLQDIQKINKELEIVVVAGDFNFSDYYNEDKIIQQNYIDIWKQIKSAEKQSYTMPRTERFDQWRPDHIIIKSNKKKITQFIKDVNFDVQRIGNFTIPPHQSQKLTDISKDNIVRCPSDHFGLFCKLSLIKSQ